MSESTTEIEMKDAPSVAESPKSTKTEIATLLFADLKANLVLLEKSSHSKETRFVNRVLRQTAISRRKITAPVLLQLLSIYPANSLSQELQGYIKKVYHEETPMEVEVASAAKASTSTQSSIHSFTPEIEAYLHLLVVLYLIDNKHYEEAIVASTSLVKKVSSFERRTLSLLAAKAFFYYSRSYELTNRLSEIRGNLLAAHRTATLRQDDESQATILNLLLRNYLEYNLVDQADKLVSKTTFREGATSSNQFARYLYYQGRIKSIQLDYTEAYKHLQQALRKAPQSSHKAKGFKQTVTKLATIVQLLMGEIPEKSIFRQTGMKTALKPYFQLTHAVHLGDLAAFQDVVTKFEAGFKADRTFTLIQRLRHNVIKTGLRKINLSYSRISLADVCSKLSLDSVEDAEYIVGKAIHDGVIDAVIDHEGSFIRSKENIDIYATHEPQETFHKRISFCMNIHNEAVKAMSFPPDAHKADLEMDEARRERQKQEQEFANTFAKEEDDLE